MKRLSCYWAVLMLAACTTQPEVVTGPENAHTELEVLPLTDPQGCLDLTEQDLFRGLGSKIHFKGFSRNILSSTLYKSSCR